MTEQLWLVHCSFGLVVVEGELIKSCPGETIVPDAPVKEIDALLESKGWRPGSDGKWVCQDHEAITEGA